MKDSATPAVKEGCVGCFSQELLTFTAGDNIDRLHGNTGIRP